MDIEIVGTLYNRVAHPSDDADIALHEDQGGFVLADAKDAPRWLGTGFGGRWKTWVIGPIASMPMIQWPRFNRFHQHRHEAEGAFVALKGALEASLPGVPIVDRLGSKDTPEAKFGLVYQQDDPEAQGNPHSLVMMDACADHDFFVHTTRVLGCVRGGNHDGPRMVSFNPPGRCTVATLKGLNDRIDHIVLAYGPAGHDAKAFVRGFLEDASFQEKTRPVRIDCMSGVITAFWSRLSGRDMLGDAADPAQALCDAGLTRKGAMPLSECLPGFDQRKAGPGAYAFLVNPGKWTGRWFFAGRPATEDDEGEEGCWALVFSRDGAESFHPELDCGMPGVASLQELGVPTPMEAAQASVQGAAMGVLDDALGEYAPSALVESAKRWARQKVMGLVAGCLSTLLFAGVSAVVLAGVAVLALGKMLLG